MKPLKTTLDELEARLQSLIESKTARFFSPKQGQDNLMTRIISTMHSEAVERTDGSRIAPNVYTLYVSPANVHPLHEDKYLLNEISRWIHEAGVKAGFHFDYPPIIKVFAREEISPQQIQVFAEITPSELINTSTLASEVGEETHSIPPHAFLIVGGNKVFPLDQAVINIGRRSDNYLVINEGQVSRLHAQIRAINGRYVIFDLDSSGGTLVNGDRVNSSKLFPGDVISLAGYPLIYGQEDDPLFSDSAGLTRPLNPNSDDL